MRIARMTETRKLACLGIIAINKIDETNNERELCLSVRVFVSVCMCGVPWALQVQKGRD
jgi:hypothetical protein